MSNTNRSLHVAQAAMTHFISNCHIILLCLIHQLQCFIKHYGSTNERKNKKATSGDKYRMILDKDQIDTTITFLVYLCYTFLQKAVPGSARRCSCILGPWVKVQKCISVEYFHSLEEVSTLLLINLKRFKILNFTPFRG